MSKPRIKVSDRLKKATDLLDKCSAEEVDVGLVNQLVNEAIHITRRGFRSSKTPSKEKRDKALSIVNKYMPSGLNIKHQAGDEFLALVKDIHKQDKLVKKKKKS